METCLRNTSLKRVHMVSVKLLTMSEKGSGGQKAEEVGGPLVSFPLTSGFSG